MRTYTKMAEGTTTAHRSAVRARSARSAYIPHFILTVLIVLRSVFLNHKLWLRLICLALLDKIND